MVQLLLNGHVDPNVQNVLGQTPIWDIIADDRHYDLLNYCFGMERKFL